MECGVGKYEVLCTGVDHFMHFPSKYFLMKWLITHLPMGVAVAKPKFCADFWTFHGISKNKSRELGSEISF